MEIKIIEKNYNFIIYFKIFVSLYKNLKFLRLGVKSYIKMHVS